MDADVGDAPSDNVDDVDSEPGQSEDGECWKSQGSDMDSEPSLSEDGKS